jgi:hypothetical protein
MWMDWVFVMFKVLDMHGSLLGMSSADYSGAVDTRIVNVERDGGILYSWKVTV